MNANPIRAKIMELVRVPLMILRASVGMDGKVERATWETVIVIAVRVEMEEPVSIWVIDSFVSALKCGKE